MTWLKGQSGNPRGRSKMDFRLAELAKTHTEQALNVLIRIATRGKSESARVTAASVLLDRGWGKPHQSVEVNGELIHTYVARLPAITAEVSDWQKQNQLIVQ
jgi:hypothetical protein